MNCPYCNYNETKVIDSRESKDSSSIKRRRECLHCNKRYSTVEKVLKLDLEVLKTNGQTEVFSLPKLKKSLLKACEKRPITLEQIEEVLDKILIDLKQNNTQTIPTSIVGNIVLTNLKEIDEIAFLKYAIVHNKYKSMKDFTDEIEKLTNFDSFDYNKMSEYK